MKETHLYFKRASNFFFWLLYFVSDCTRHVLFFILPVFARINDVEEKKLDSYSVQTIYHFTSFSLLSVFFMPPFSRWANEPWFWQIVFRVVLSVGRESTACNTGLPRIHLTYQPVRFTLKKLLDKETNTLTDILRTEMLSPLHQHTNWDRQRIAYAVQS